MTGILRRRRNSCNKMGQEDANRYLVLSKCVSTESVKASNDFLGVQDETHMNK